jgi:peptidoglycan/xylan/chitin deacetylase (PgdA/CDA1 family)
MADRAHVCYMPAMIVKNLVSSLWQAVPADVEHRLAAVLDAAPGQCRVFFRADDVAVPGRAMARMLEVFTANRVPLCMAVVPAWLNASRWHELRAKAGESSQWCWHQHGWRHHNHQTMGKKGEFGNERDAQAKQADIERGRDKLAGLMGRDFQPFFTPPWNRFDRETGEILARTGFRAVSRSAGEGKKVPLPPGLPDLCINTDLHTRNESTPAEGWDALFAEFKDALATGRCGVMLHHQRTNGAAFDFLDLLLRAVRSHPNTEAVTFDDLL